MVIFGENSQLIAEAARCAGDQGKFWEFHAKGFTLKSAD
jgi:protein-disulfide isomerase